MSVFEFANSYAGDRKRGKRAAAARTRRRPAWLRSAAPLGGVAADLHMPFWTYSPLWGGASVRRRKGLLGSESWTNLQWQWWEGLGGVQRTDVRWGSTTAAEHATQRSTHSITKVSYSIETLNVRSGVKQRSYVRFGQPRTLRAQTHGIVCLLPELECFSHRTNADNAILPTILVPNARKLPKCPGPARAGLLVRGARRHMPPHEPVRGTITT